MDNTRITFFRLTSGSGANPAQALRRYDQENEIE